jgi:hypothetical protein
MTRNLLIALTLAVCMLGVAGVASGATSWIAWMLLALALGGLIGALLVDRVPDALPRFAAVLGGGCAVFGIGGLLTRATPWMWMGALGFALAFGMLGLGAGLGLGATHAEA